MEKLKVPDLKSLLSSVAIKPGDIPQIEFEHKNSVIRASTRVPQNTFFRAHSSYEQLFMMVPSGKGMDAKMFIIGPGLILPAHLFESIIPIYCHLIAYADGELQILERKCARPGEPLNDYQQSSLKVVIAAKKKWVMRRWNKKTMLYDHVEAGDDYAPEPKWPNLDFMDILSIAYDGRIIDSIDHPVYKELAGIKASIDND